MMVIIYNYIFIFMTSASNDLDVFFRHIFVSVSHRSQTKNQTGKHTE